MTVRLLDYDPITGIKTWHEYDSVTKEMHIHTTYTNSQTDAVLDNNKRLYNDDDKGWAPGKEWRRAAEIPMSVVHDWLINEGIDVFNPNDAAAVRRKLNSNEYLYLRTAPGKL